MKKHIILVFVYLLSGSSLYARGEVFLNSPTIEKGTAVILKMTSAAEPKIYFGYDRIYPDFIQNTYVAIIPIDISEPREKEFIDVILGDQLHVFTVSFTELKSRTRYITFRGKNKKYVPSAKQIAEAEIKQKKENAAIEIRNLYHPEIYFEGKFILPIRNISRQLFYGDKRVVRRGRLKERSIYHHRGIDIAARKGTPVYASQAGKVVIAKRMSHRGIMVMIDHGLGIYTEYLHLSRLLVRNGQWVKQGQAIGKVGSTGLSTGPHLHWSFIVKGTLVNPIFWTNPMISQIFSKDSALTKKSNVKKTNSI